MYSIINGDALDCLDSIQSNFQLIISSPPYNIGKSYEKKQSLEQYLIWQEKIIVKLYEHLLDTGSIVWQVGNYVDDGEIFPLDLYFYPIFKKLSMKLRNRIIWHFEHGLHCQHRLSGRYETLLWFTKTNNYVFNLDSIRIPSKYPNKKYFKGPKKGQLSCNPLGKNPSDVWTIKDEFDEGIMDITNIKHNHPEKTVHPCQFPVELVSRFILALTNENDWILDPFGGVGTTLVASKQHNRNGIMIEKEQMYCDIAQKRLNEINPLEI